MPVQKRDWTLLAIDAAGEGGLTPAQLQKALFLLSKAHSTTLDTFYNFTPYNYGPFDKAIYTDAASLAQEQLVDTEPVDGKQWSKYYATPTGHATAAATAATADDASLQYLKEVVNWVQGLSFQQLIASIYKRYPEYKVNSVFRG